MSQLCVYETSRPAAAATAAVLSNNSNPFVSLSSPVSTATATSFSLRFSFCRSLSLALSLSLSFSFSLSIYLYVSLFTRVHTETHSFTVFSRPCVQTIRNIKMIRPRPCVCMFTRFNYLNTHTRRVVYQSNLTSVFKCLTFPLPIITLPKHPLRHPCVFLVYGDGPRDEHRDKYRVIVPP